LRKELAHLRRLNHTRTRLLFLLILVVSAASALLLWRSNRDKLIAQSNEQAQSKLGLLELRVNQHRTTVQDWGHWDDMVAYVTGKDPGFVARELNLSSIIEDHQMLIVFNREGQQLTVRSKPRIPVGAPLLACIEQRLQVLQSLTPEAPSRHTFGFFCQVGKEEVIGAGTSIRSSKGSLPEYGWLFHLSTLQRPNYPDSLNHTFRTISRTVVHRRHGELALEQPIPAISELLPPGERFLLVPLLSPFEVAIAAAEDTITDWLEINLGLLSLCSFGLLLRRQGRLTRHIRDRQELQSARKRLYRKSQVLASRRHLLIAFTGDPGTHRGSWIAAIRLARVGGHGASPKPATLEQCFQSMAQALSAEFQSQLMGRMDQETLLLAFKPGRQSPAALVQNLSRIVQQPEHAAAASGFCPVCCVAPLQPVGQVQQVLNLCLALGQLAPGQAIAFLSAGVSAGPLLPRRPAEATSAAPILSPADGLVQMDPVVALLADERRVLYREVSFAAGAASVDGSVDTPPEPQRNHQLDLSLIRLVLDWLQQPSKNSGAQDYGVSLSLDSLSSPGHFLAVLEILQTLPVPRRRQLVIEMTETLLMFDPDHFATQVRQLRALGVRIAVTDFGTGYVPIPELFALKPDFLKLSAEYTPQLHDETIDSLVDFLVSYCRYTHCTFVLQGVDRPQQLHYWQRMGAKVFQGSFLAGSSSSAALRSRQDR
jgi:EAL domain-containing protein (putative c-di-GMP-specific phosphodiesterase class I)